MSLDSIIQVNISRETAQITQAGFGTMLILGPNAPAGVSTYADIDEVGEDFETTDPEYKMAQKAFSQEPRIEAVKIAPSNLTAQVATFTVTAENNGEYTVNIYATQAALDEETPTKTYTYTASGSATQSEIVEGLTRLINGESVQLLEFDAVPDAGTFKLYFGALPVTLSFSDNAVQIQTKLRTIPALAAIVVTGDYTEGMEIVMRGVAYGEDGVPLLAINDNELTASSVPVVASIDYVETGADESGSGVIASGSTTLILTAREAGDAFLYDTSGNLEGEDTTPSGDIVDAIEEARSVDDDWYFLALAEVSTAQVIKDVAAYTEAIRRIFIFRNGDADVRTAATNDLQSQLVAAAYFRTAMLYSGTLTDYPDAAFIGRLAPYDPGSETWAYKTLSGVTVDNWNSTEKTHLNTKNANYYGRLAGVNVTFNGKTAGGEYIDVIRFSDWLVARIQEEVFGTLARNRKIPFTDSGIACVEASIRAVLLRGVAAGGIASAEDFTVTVPKASSISANDKAARRLTGVKFTARLAGAIHSIVINGNVTL
jgi:hypothetical protein